MVASVACEAVSQLDSVAAAAGASGSGEEREGVLRRLRLVLSAFQAAEQRTDDELQARAGLKAGLRAC